MTLTKQEFAKYIQYLKDNWDFENELSSVFIKHQGDITITDKPDCASGLLDILSRVMNDKSDWISYYCYELDFGRNWEPGMITDSDGKDVPLGTVDDLWRLLNDNLKNE